MQTHFIPPVKLHPLRLPAIRKSAKCRIVKPIDVLLRAEVARISRSDVAYAHHFMKVSAHLVKTNGMVVCDVIEIAEEGWGGGGE